LQVAADRCGRSPSRDRNQGDDADGHRAYRAGAERQRRIAAYPSKVSVGHRELAEKAQKLDDFFSKIIYETSRLLYLLQKATVLVTSLDCRIESS
jgi:hypothetical protein